MPEEHKKANFKTGLKENILFSLQKLKLLQNVSTHVHWHAEERKSDGILTLNLATVITAAAYKLCTWAEMNL